MGHTAPTWHAVVGASHADVVNGDGTLICTVPEDLPEWKDNLALIIASPEMFYCLAKLLERIKDLRLETVIGKPALVPAQRIMDQIKRAEIDNAIAGMPHFNIERAGTPIQMAYEGWALFRLTQEAT